MMEAKDWFKQEFEHFEAAPREDLWIAIDAQLRDSKRKRKAWIPYVSLAASILILLGVLWVFTPLGSSTESPMASSEQGVRAGSSAQPRGTEAPRTAPGSGSAEDGTASERAQRPTTTESNPRREPGRAAALEALAARDQAPDAPPSLALAESRNEGAAELPPDSMGPRHRSPRLREIQAPPSAVALASHALKPEAEPAPTTKVAAFFRPRVRRVGQTKRLDLTELSLSSAVSFAANGLNFLTDAPIEVEQKTEEEADEVSKTYIIRLKNFSIVKKHHQKVVKNQES